MTKSNKIEYIEEEGAQDAAEKAEKLRKALKKCRGERQEYLEGWQRARADHQNYIKQSEQEMREFRKFASANVVLRAIPVLDNLFLACESMPADVAQSNWAKGIEQIRKHLESVLKENGVEEIKVQKGDRFDPAHNEAAEEAESGGERGTVAEVLQRGYTLNGKVIRPARVKVNK